MTEQEIFKNECLSYNLSIGLDKKTIYTKIGVAGVVGLSYSLSAIPFILIKPENFKFIIEE